MFKLNILVSFVTINVAKASKSRVYEASKKLAHHIAANRHLQKRFKSHKLYINLTPLPRVPTI